MIPGELLCIPDLSRRRIILVRPHLNTVGKPLIFIDGEPEKYPQHESERAKEIRQLYRLSCSAVVITIQWRNKYHVDTLNPPLFSPSKRDFRHFCISEHGRYG